MSSLTADPARLSPATTLGAVSLTVSDLGRARAFYEGVLGLLSIERDDGELELAGADGRPLVMLRADPSATPRDPRAPGLFHLAILFPARVDLAAALARLAQARWPLSGASDHLVSEALYLEDPDGNGIELYHDRPSSDWPRDDAGEIQMATLRLDLDDLLGELGSGNGIGPGIGFDGPAPAGTRIGHVHLQVADIPRARSFYAEALGFTPTVESYPGALFISAGGYHHHIGLNAWNSAGASPPAPGAVGLRHFEIVVADDAELHRVAERLRAAGFPVEDSTPGAMEVSDPFAVGLRLRVA